MDRIKEIDISIDVKERIVYNRNIPVLSYFDTDTSSEFVGMLEDIIHENNRLRDELSKKSHLLRMFVSEEDESRIKQALREDDKG